jgi:hypothetical protein
VIHGRSPSWLRDGVNSDFADFLATAERAKPALRPAIDALSAALLRTVSEIQASVRTFGPGHPFPKPRLNARVVPPLRPTLSPDRRVFVLRYRYSGIAAGRLWLYDVFLNGDHFATIGPGRWRGSPSGTKSVRLPSAGNPLRPGDDLAIYVFVDGNLLGKTRYAVPGDG